MFLTRSEYGKLAFQLLNTSHKLNDVADRGVNTFSPEGRLFQGESHVRDQTIH
jgi:hypothetical protein